MKENMMNRKKYVTWFLPMMVVLVLGATSCANYERPLNTEPIPEEPSFSEDIIPFFETSCAYTGCHDSGGIPPDLTEDAAYLSLTTGGFIDTDNPSQSELYVKMAPGGSMEQYSTTRDTQMVLRWIEQGAQNN
jgi:hypothetical protein